MVQVEELLSKKHLVVVYDGDCPFCSAYVKMLRLRDSVGTVELLNARDDSEIVRSFSACGKSLDDGMAAFYGNQLYYGSDAIALLSGLTTHSGGFNRLLAKMLRRPALARTIYPVMRMGRRAVLTLLGRQKLPSIFC